jgi:hypothetical protein
MKKVIIAIIILLIIFIILNSLDLPIGFYFPPPMDFIYCTTEESCFHEEAHRLDWQLGFPSKGIEFRKAMDEIPELSEIPIGPGEKYSEAYANFYAIFEGNVPWPYVKFYSLTKTCDPEIQANGETIIICKSKRR